MGTAVLFARFVVSLAVVLGLMWVIARSLRKRGLAPAPGGRNAATVEVLARRGLGRNASVAIVRAGGKALVLGVTESQITMLAEADPGNIDLAQMEVQRTALPGEAPAVTSTTWKAMLEGLREKTVRR